MTESSSPSQTETLLWIFLILSQENLQSGKIQSQMTPCVNLCLVVFLTEVGMERGGGLSKIGSWCQGRKALTLCPWHSPNLDCPQLLFSLAGNFPLLLKKITDSGWDVGREKDSNPSPYHHLHFNTLQLLFLFKSKQQTVFNVTCTCLCITFATEKWKSGTCLVYKLWKQSI